MFWMSSRTSLDMTAEVEKETGVVRYRLSRDESEGALNGGKPYILFFINNKSFTVKHLIENNSLCPNIRFLRVLVVEYCLGSHVERSTDVEVPKY